MIGAVALKRFKGERIKKVVLFAESEIDIRPLVQLLMQP